MNNNTLYAGKIQVRQTKRGTEFHAFNHERGRSVHVGTGKGSVYEKGNVSILRKPEPSICLSQEEYGAAVTEGLTTFRVKTNGETYVIGFDDFARFKQDYFNPAYGPQWRVALRYFQKSATTKKRNAILDNPPVQSPGYQRPQAEQLPMFQPRYDAMGNYRG